MFVGFDEDDREFEQAALSFLYEQVSVDFLRGYWARGVRLGRGTESALWDQLADLDLTTLTVPNRYGGLGLGLTRVVPTLEAAGRVALPEPYIETVMIAVPVLTALAEARDSEVAGNWLERIAEGIAVAYAPGPSAAVAYPSQATGLFGWDEEGLYFTETSGAELVEEEDTGDRGRPVAKVRGLDPAATWRPPDPGGELRALARDLGRLGFAVFLNGISLRLIEETREYVSARHQFGRPIGSFQAIQHQLARALIQVECARSCGWHGVWAAEALCPEDRHQAAHSCKCVANMAHREVNNLALQYHGALGFTWDHHLHLYLRRGKELEYSFGSTTEHAVALGRRLIPVELGGERWLSPRA